MVRQEKNEEAIFNAAIELGSRDERDAYLAKACGDDNFVGNVHCLLKNVGL